MAGVSIIKVDQEFKIDIGPLDCLESEENKAHQPMVLGRLTKNLELTQDRKFAWNDRQTGSICNEFEARQSIQFTKLDTFTTKDLIQCSMTSKLPGIARGISIQSLKGRVCLEC